MADSNDIDDKTKATDKKPEKKKPKKNKNEGKENKKTQKQDTAAGADGSFISVMLALIAQLNRETSDIGLDLAKKGLSKLFGKDKRRRK